MSVEFGARNVLINLMKIIAYYLPQFYQIPENDTWWGEGFTEWTNVQKAGKLYKDHYQPKIPGELGYYNLKDHNVRESQAKLAREAGVDGFCYWHYWFGPGDQLLEHPIEDILKRKKPSLPFCLAWANESWRAKVWSDRAKDRILKKQIYGGKNDYRQHFYSNLNAFKDDRYIKIDGKPIFVIYKPFDIPNATEFMDYWNLLAKQEGLINGLYFIAHTEKNLEVEKLFALGFNAVNIVRNGEYAHNWKLIIKAIIPIVLYKLFNKPLVIKYSLIMRYFTQKLEISDKVYPTIIPNWDHTPRSGKRGSVFHNSTPMLFRQHIKRVFNVIKNKPREDQVVFIKSWNEWGEGNYMEPDKKYGKQYIETLSDEKRRFLGK